MSHFAKIGENNIVLEVLYMETSVSSTEGGIEDESVGLAHLRTHHGHDNWKRCSYNSRGGQHYAIDSNGDYVPDGSPGYRANYPSEGWFGMKQMKYFVNQDQMIKMENHVLRGQ